MALTGLRATGEIMRILIESHLISGNLLLHITVIRNFVACLLL